MCPEYGDRPARPPSRPRAAAQAGPETGHHTVPDSLRDEALAKFFAEPCACAPTTGGVNNVCQYVTTADGRRFILRVRRGGALGPGTTGRHWEQADFALRRRQLRRALLRSAHATKT